MDKQLLKCIAGQFATGVTVVTCGDGQGGIAGLTASSFSSLSLEPPLVLFCVEYVADSYAHLLREQRFAVHILADDQVAVAYHFARKGDKSSGADWSLSERGVPVLNRALARYECELYRDHEGGDHAIIVGHVIYVEINDKLPNPLLYCRGKISDVASFGQVISGHAVAS